MTLVQCRTEKTLVFLRYNLVNGRLLRGDSLPGVGQHWVKVIERVGWLILAALALVISWVLAIRAFEWVLNVLGG